MTKDKDASPDWERIEFDYRAGILSLREIAGEHGLTHGAINKRAKRDGWERDLSAKIKAKADALVSKSLVSAEVSAQRLVTEREIVDAGALRIAQVREEHRRDISRARALFAGLIGQLEAVSGADGKTLIGKLFTIVHSPNDEDDEQGKKRAQKMAETLDKVLSLPSNVDSAKKLTEMLEKLVRLEREAYDIATPGQPGVPQDQPPAAYAPNDIARRIAFALAQGLKKE